MQNKNQGVQAQLAKQTKIRRVCKLIWTASALEFRRLLCQ